MFGDADLPIFFKDFGRTVIAGAQSALANFEAPGGGIDLRTLAPIAGVDYAITYPTTALSLVSRQQITVDGFPFQVTSADPIESNQWGASDGLISKAKLKYLGPPTGPGAVVPVTSAPWGKKMFNETPDSARIVFTLSSKTSAAVLQVIADGMVLAAPNDYSLGSDGITVTFVAAPEAGRPLFVYA
jgi:hypothetical protein